MRVVDIALKFNYYVLYWIRQAGIAWELDYDRYLETDL